MVVIYVHQHDNGDAMMEENADMLVKYLRVDSALLVQPTNCVATQINTNTLSGKIATKLPYANPYKKRDNIRGFKNLATKDCRPKPGTIDIFLPTPDYQGNAGVAYLYTQFQAQSFYFEYCYKNLIDEEYWSELKKDKLGNRLVNFRKCLLKLRDELVTNPSLTKYTTVVFPPRLGMEYNQAIIAFSRDILLKGKNIKCVICNPQYE